MGPFLHDKRIRILFFSDVHESIHEDKVQSIIKKLLEGYPSDYIFIGGDLGTVIHDNDYSNETASEERNEPLYENLFLNEVSQLGVPILWIPGNHDSASAFETDDFDKSRKVFNVHNRVMEIAPNLFVLGVGGSAPAYDRDGQLIWKGYPDQEKDIAIDKAMGCAQTIPDSASVILFTHCPPSIAPSSQIIYPRKNRHLYAGSQSLTTLFNTLSSTLTIPLYLHGHCHCNLASNIVYTENQSTIVCSSGAFRDSFFIHVEMEYKCDRWSICKQNLCILPNDDD